MRRSLIAAVLLFTSSALMAAETRRYIVATDRSVGDREIRALVRDLDGSATSRTPTVRFRNVDAFAADLTDAEVARLRTAPGVEYIEPVVERRALSLSTAQVVPYGIDLIKARPVWPTGRGTGTNVVVADTGVDFNHPELKEIWQGGLNTFDPARKLAPIDDNGHGTHVAGTIAAADNEVGVVGVAPQVRLWGIKVLNSEGTGTSDKVIEAIDWVMSKKKELGGNWVVNLSLGSDSQSLKERDAFTRAIDAGIVIAAASGNESKPDKIAPVSYPAAYPGVIAVGAVSQTSSIASFSNQGPELDVVGPGVGIFSTVPVGSGSIVYAQKGSDIIPAASVLGSPRAVVTGEYVFCGIGRPQDIPAKVAGKIALIRRGEIKFYEKAYNAKKAGAIAVIIFNHDDTQQWTNWTIEPTDAPDLATFAFPLTIALPRAEGEKLAASSGTVTAASDVYDYATFNGTSMATPHVAGAAALIWSLAPNASGKEIAEVLVSTATDLGQAGRDPVYGAGLVDIEAAARRLTPGAGESPAKPEEHAPSTGRPAGFRGRK